MTATPTSRGAMPKPGFIGRRHAPMPCADPWAFTLIEVLITAGLITLLLAILLPGLGRARQQASAVACRSNIRQLVLANDLYSRDAGGRYVPGAARIRTQNVDRWHGKRHSMADPFDGKNGPLAPYLGADNAIRACPSFATEIRPDPGGIQFEAGCGGYGYNNAYLGVRGRALGMDKGERLTLAGAALHSVRSPAATLMFADTAFAGEQLIEYSFAEPRFQTQYGTRADPSIHFRHSAWANVAWCDGHVTAEQRTFTWSSGLYSQNPDRLGIGWFGTTDDNSVFDLQ